VTSSLVAMPVYERETLPEEREDWKQVAAGHRAEIERVFEGLHSEKILLFCHDPTALPFLWSCAAVQKRSAQIERTIIGHLHSELILRQSRLLSWLPKITSCGTTTARISSALSRAKDWRHFRV